VTAKQLCLFPFIPRRQDELTVLDDRRRVDHGFPPIARDSA
jgi:hypothetical protein